MNVFLIYFFKLKTYLYVWIHKNAYILYLVEAYGPAVSRSKSQGKFIRVLSVLGNGRRKSGSFGWYIPQNRRPQLDPPRQPLFVG